MPNYVTNILTVEGASTEVRQMFEAIQLDEIGIGSIDFNKIIPIPEYTHQGNHSISMQKIWKYWGTNWNSCGYDEFTSQIFDGSTVEFLTAWNSSEVVITALARQYPNLFFSLKWAEECIGTDVGQMEFEDGMVIYSYLPDDNSKEALELAAQIHNVNLEDEGFIYNEELGEYEQVFGQ